jgi:hypothetical protein
MTSVSSQLSVKPRCWRQTLDMCWAGRQERLWVATTGWIVVIGEGATQKTVSCWRSLYSASTRDTKTSKVSRIIGQSKFREKSQTVGKQSCK